MFKNILPTKRLASNLPSKDLSQSSYEGKENAEPNPESPKKSSIPVRTNPRDRQAIQIQDPKDKEKIITENAFEKLLDELQIPEALRPKLTSLDVPVKAAMLRSSNILSPRDQAPAPSKRPKLRRSLSSNHIDLATKGLVLPDISTFPQLDGDILSPPTAPFMKDGASRPSSPFGRSHSRGVSMDRSISSSFNANKNNSKMSKGTFKDISPVAMYTVLSETSSTQLDIELVKKLRLLLRNESASWSEGFLANGGYTVLLTRLMEILEVEWREEQHDDKLLYELLRCFRALSTSSIGCIALRSCSPTPFAQLVKLLYSDKKPGDICSRQLIIELLLILFDIYPNPTLASQKPVKRSHEFLENVQTSIQEVSLPSPHQTLFSFIRTLLLTPAPPPAECSSIPIAPHDFMTSLHTPRVYKTYLKELSDVCRDYFWIFCHPQNTIWNLEQTDERKVERPKAPGGMTSGVEFEAMTYLTTHFQFINSLAKAAEHLNSSQDNELTARKFHVDLFASGLERIILTARKASTTYYGMLHLEIARYVVNAKQSGCELPWPLIRHIGSPPSHLCLPGTVSRNRTPQGSPTKNKTQGLPIIPTPPRAGAIKIE